MKYLKGPKQEHLEPLLITIWQQDNIYRTETTTWPTNGEEVLASKETLLRTHHLVICDLMV